jgi:hypothetical protein
MNSFSRIFTRLVFTLSIVAGISKASPTPFDEAAVVVDSNTSNETDNNAVIITTEADHTLSIKKGGSDCFPGIGFKMPRELPNTLTGWWCDWDAEYAFVGFSYEVSECMNPIFLRMCSD